MTKNINLQPDESTGTQENHPAKPDSEKIDLKAHWDSAYEDASVAKLGWYEESPEPSTRLINKCNLDKSAVILNVGAGATTLVDVLLREGFTRLIANDLSATALDKIKERLGSASSRVEWIVDDLTQPHMLSQLGEIDLWHDRAALHFLVDEENQTTYFNLLKSLVKKGGFVIIAAFNLEGAKMCSGLPVHRYNASMLLKRLGDGYELIESFDYTYTMPSGAFRDYVYTLFKRIT